MYIFRCRRCHAEVTTPLGEVPLPDPDEARAPYEMPAGQECPQRMRAGSFAFDPRPGDPHRIMPVSDREPVVLPEHAGVTGVLVNRGDVRAVKTSSVRGRVNGCCGLDGCDGPNLVCEFCTAEIGVERSDCWTPQEVVFVAGAVEFVLAPAGPGGERAGG